MADEIPRPFFQYDKPVFQVGKKPNAKATGGIALIAKEPSAKDVAVLRAFLDANGPRTVVVIGPEVPLSVLQHVVGVPFVVLDAGRASFDGLAALPNSVRRLAIREPSGPLSLAELPTDTAIEELELDAPRIHDVKPLPKLRTLGWKRMTDDGAAFVTVQPNLFELALRDSATTRLPPSNSLERLILFAPTKLTSLAGVEALPALRFLRVDAPESMARLGSLADARALRTLILVGAHAIADLTDIATPPELDSVGIIQTDLDERPFLGLRGRLKGGSFQLATHDASKRLFEHLGVPYSTAELIENHFFDE